jgi:ADP-dependent NAD(P)H-hydrate dehydratase / NAD(P)H-hydrate epimerase
MAATLPAWPARDSAHLLVSSAQMAALEEQLFASGLPVEALMEKAALALTARLRQDDWWPQLRRRGVLVLVGPGHNGGDGLVVARELQLAGLPVRIWSPFERHKPLTAAHWRHARWLGIPALEQPPQPDEEAIWIDALFGIGQSRPLDDSLVALLGQRQQARPGGLIAVDVPSGLCADRGEPLGTNAACAGLTLCIGLIKQGLVQDSALAWVGQLERIDLGLPAPLLQTLAPEPPRLLWPNDLQQAPWAPAPTAASKYERGRLLVVAGSTTYRGAAHLCLQGASASGCGSIRAALPAAMADQLWQPLPHVVVSASVGSHPAGGMELAQLPPAILERLDAVVLGPGLGEAGSSSDSSLWEALQQLEALLLLDADGLNRLAARGEALAWLRGRRGPTWLTPHRGEFQRLFPELAHCSALEAAGEAALRSGCSLLLKGARSVVAASDGRRWQLGWANPQAARAGLGDVLAGYAAGRAAMAVATIGTADAQQLAMAALEHAVAAESAVQQRGPGQATPLNVAMALQAHTIAAPICNDSTTEAKPWA